MSETCARRGCSNPAPDGGRFCSGECADAPDREPADRRRTETYREDHWTVLDVDGVDKTFATDAPGDDDAPRMVRVDVDGVVAESMTNDVGEPGDNANISVWVEVSTARELADQLRDATDAAEEGDE